MILGNSPLGTTPLGLPGGESTPFASEPPSVAVQVAAGVPVAYNGGASYPPAAVVIVRTGRIRAGLKSVADNPGAIRVSGRTPVSLVVFAPDAARVEVRGVPVSGGIQVVLPSAAINVAGNAPVSSATAGGSPAMVAVAGWAPVAKAVSGQSPVSVVVRGAAPKTAALTVALPAGVNVAAGAVTSRLCVLPLSALVWVRCGVIVEQEAASGGLTVVLNAKTLAVSEYGIGGVLDVVEHDGEAYFVAAESILVQRAGDGVFGVVTTGDLDLGGVNSVALNIAHLDLQSDGALHLIATALQDGDEKSKRYLVPTRPGASDRNRRVRLGKGMLGNAWRFTLAPPSDKVCNWSLSGWTVETDRSKSRRR